MTSDTARWKVLRAQQEARHGAAIAYVRGQVGVGTEYSNEAARMVFSEKGAYYELLELPEEFVGAVGEGVPRKLLSITAAGEFMQEIQALIKSIADHKDIVQTLSLYVLYAGGSLKTQSGMFLFDYQSHTQPIFTHGAWQPDLPRVVKLRLHLTPEHALLPGLPRSGIVILLTPENTDGEQSLVATIERDPSTRDLSQRPLPPHERMN